MDGLKTAQNGVTWEETDLLVRGGSRDVRIWSCQELLDLVPDAFVVTDTLGIIRAANHAASIMLRMSREQLVGMSLTVFAPAEDRAAFRQYLSALIANEDVSQLEILMSTYSGASPFHASVRAVVTRDSRGCPIGLRWLIRDMTFRRDGYDKLSQTDTKVEERARELERLLKRQQEFIQTLSQDLKSPIETISGSALMANQCAEPEIVRSYLSDIISSARKVSAMIADLKEISSAWAEGPTIEARPIHPKFFVEELLQRLDGVIETGRVRLDISAGLPLVSADPRQLERILANVLRHFLNRSRRKITVRCRASGGEMLVSVIDRVAGLPEAEPSQVFGDPYEAANGHGWQSSDLGLFVAKRFVEAHGGKIWMASKEGRSASIRFTLPLAGRR